MEKSIVVLTGSFNPITKAHRTVLETAVSYVGAEKGLFVCVNDDYLIKKNYIKRSNNKVILLSEKERKEMIDSLSTDFPNLIYGGVELGNAAPSTVKTLLKINKSFPGYKIYYLCGADKLKSIPKWKDINKVIENMGFIVFEREGYDIDKIINDNPYLTAHKDIIIKLPTSLSICSISSTELRNRIYNGLDYSDLVDNGPLSILKKYSDKDFKDITTQDVIDCKIKYCKFGKNAARLLVFKDNINRYKSLENKYKDSKLYTSEFSVNPNNNFDLETSVINKDCVDVASKLVKDGEKVAILNLADRFTPCGMFNKGKLAQEESLCYSSTLPMSLLMYGKKTLKHVKEIGGGIKEGYPMDINFGGIYSNDVCFFRDNISNNYRIKNNFFSCPVITVASLSNGKNSVEKEYFNNDGSLNEDGLKIEKNKVRTIYRIALDNNIDTLVLGAFGCGVFNLIPEEVSSIFYDVLEEDEFKNKFKKIVFAITEKKSRKQPFIEENGKYKPFYDKFN